ncbi:hypothetical protein IE81DRAFT_323205 [Ceraceosorus guamensis]|uniref:Uncharacterized protein n=1 Tax=Ceraceosorus guamensis TaxID=1522189 RepID=A0A316VYT2_9BASI|nr:hypothetical protein IE81DRAFT_323205 [Ceraceosorus guamensis]PWN42660.1 hypothetical protein IE81DRAFT_323205 [Ceraceosorus guamensis]
MLVKQQQQQQQQRIQDLPLRPFASRHKGPDATPSLTFVWSASSPSLEAPLVLCLIRLPVLEYVLACAWMHMVRRA